MTIKGKIIQVLTFTNNEKHFILDTDFRYNKKIIKNVIVKTQFDKKNKSLFNIIKGLEKYQKIKVKGTTKTMNDILFIESNDIKLIEE